MTTIMTIGRQLTDGEVSYIEGAMRNAVTKSILGECRNPARGLTPFVYTGTPGNTAFIAVEEDNIDRDARHHLYVVANDASDRAWKLHIAARDKAIAGRRR
jgi:hypothetical protein